MSYLPTSAYTILGFLQFGPQSGYELKANIDAGPSFFWNVAQGAIYPLLKRLAADGLIDGTDAPTGARPKTEWALTDAGRGALRSWLDSPGDTTQVVRDEELLKIFMGDGTDPERILDIVRARRERIQTHLEMLERTDAETRDTRATSPIRFPFITLDFGIALNRWHIEWCDDVERRIKKEKRL